MAAYFLETGALATSRVGSDSPSMHVNLGKSPAET
jgi:hypothetical protein